MFQTCWLYLVLLLRDSKVWNNSTFFSSVQASHSLFSPGQPFLGTRTGRAVPGIKSTWKKLNCFRLLNPSKGALDAFPHSFEDALITSYFLWGNPTLQRWEQEWGVKSLKQFNFFQVDLIPGTAGESIGELDFPIESNRLTRRQQSTLSRLHFPHSPLEKVYRK